MAVSFAGKLPEIWKNAHDDGTILFCGSIHSGNSHNVVADKANLWGTLRTCSEDDSGRIKDAMTAELRKAAEQFGTHGELLWEGGCPPVCNDERIAQELSRLLPELSCDAVPTLVGEDFVFYQQKAPGAMLWLEIAGHEWIDEEE